MATGNTSYIYSLSGSTYAYTGIAFEMMGLQEWTDAFFDDEPLLRLIREGGANWNKSGRVSGRSVLFPIMLADATTLVANGVTDDNELGQPTAEVTAGFTQAEYEIAHYRMPIWWRASEEKLVTGKEAMAGAMRGKVMQVGGSFKNAVNGDLMSANAGARDKVHGVRHVLSESNTVGGIAQGTDTIWQAKVTTGAGTFTLDAVNDVYDEATRGKERPDILLAAYAASNNVFGKFRSAIQPAQQLTKGNKADYGFTDLVYLDAIVVKDDAGTSGEVLGLNSKTWHWLGDTMPKLHSRGPWPGTDAEVIVYNMFCAVGCTNPRLNFRLAGLT